MGAPMRPAALPKRTAPRGRAPMKVIPIRLMRRPRPVKNGRVQGDCVGQSGPVVDDISDQGLAGRHFETFGHAEESAGEKEVPDPDDPEEGHSGQDQHGAQVEDPGVNDEASPVEPVGQRSSERSEENGGSVHEETDQPQFKGIPGQPEYQPPHGGQGPPGSG